MRDAFSPLPRFFFQFSTDLPATLMSFETRECRPRGVEILSPLRPLADFAHLAKRRSCQLCRAEYLYCSFLRSEKSHAEVECARGMLYKRPVLKGGLGEREGDLRFAPARYSASCNFLRGAHSGTFDLENSICRHECFQPSTTVFPPPPCTPLICDPSGAKKKI